MPAYRFLGLEQPSDFVQGKPVSAMQAFNFPSKHSGRLIALFRERNGPILMTGSSVQEAAAFL